ncbi:bile acid-CoA:amino acid N-acyltransferase-like [Haliotis rubra]|uniref:bile acid-CoA:amino acid N-acyltransferase-like n=1 Tax=Haliotis rubra TaxID=36100 RepID=UPI001EE5D41D|nr:bile acid-CoA:amino acid N-acyltransferase-like [Haliotis rubra]XP_046567761.1 bile acid-CoA:amino acid N-acyltransferase-like [Haliotis rubra]
MVLRKLIVHNFIKSFIKIEKRSSVVIFKYSLTTMVGPSLHVSQPEVLVDEKVRVTVTGLRRHQKVTLLSTQVENNKNFASCGHFVADDHGSVDTFVHESHGGTYSGLQPMGLFTSTREPFGTSRLLKLDVTTPYDVTLSIHDDHREFAPLAREYMLSHSALAETSLKRWYMRPGVKKIIVDEDGIYGALLLPPGEGPFPGIVDVFGMAGGIMDYRAALLASHGFAAFSLAYIAYKDLPKKPEDLDVKYFLRGVEWLAGQSVVARGGVGMIGHCVGGSLCMTTSTLSPHVKVLVSTNGNPFMMLPQDIYIDDIAVRGTKFDVRKCTFTDEGVIQRDAFKEYNLKEHILPIWRRDIKTLIVVGEEDLCVDPLWQHDLEAAIPGDKKKNFRFVYYPGAGHLIEPPYSPLCKASYNKILGVTHLWGGEEEHHLPAQEDAWREILMFLNTHMTPKSQL